MKRRLIPVIFMIMLFMQLTTASASNSDTMFIHMMESMNTFVDNPYNTRAFVQNVIDGNSSTRTALTFGDEKYYNNSRYSRSLFINTIAVSETTKNSWKPSAQEAKARVNNLIMKLYDFSSGRSADDGPMPVESKAFKSLLNSNWMVDGFFSGYMNGKTISTDNTFTWEIFPFYILIDNDIIRNSELFVYFRVSVPAGNVNSYQVYEYIVGDYSEVNHLLLQLMQLNKNLDGWDKQLMQALVR